MEDVSTKGWTVGLDLSDQVASYCIVDAAAEVVDRGKVRLRKDVLARRFGAMGRCRVVMEVGTHSPWVSRVLSEWHEVVVANPATVAWIARSGKKTDRVDAEFLARVGRADVRLLQPVTHRSEELQADLSVVRARAELVKVRTTLVNSVRGLLKANGYRLGGQSWRRLRERVLAVECGPALEAAALAMVAVVEETSARIADLEAEMERMANERYPAVELLKTVPGVGPVIALTYVLTLGDPMRFRRSRDVGAYFGLTPAKDQSGKRDPELRISKQGDREVRRLLVQAAHTLVHRGPENHLQRWANGRLASGAKNAKKRTIVAVARKLAVLLHRLWVSGEVFDPAYRSGREEAPMRRVAA